MDEKMPAKLSQTSYYGVDLERYVKDPNISHVSFRVLMALILYARDHEIVDGAYNVSSYILGEYGIKRSTVHPALKELSEAGILNYGNRKSHQTGRRTTYFRFQIPLEYQPRETDIKAMVQWLHNTFLHQDCL